MRSSDLTSTDFARLSSPTELMDRQWAPCRYYCPVHADVRLYLEHAAAGRFAEAVDVIRRNLPFAGVCGRVCHHPCEVNCRRNDVDAPVAIREVKRFVAELAGAGATVRKAVQDKAAVAVVGGGPAGLAAALELAKKGYRPTVFEKFPRAGGVPATAIPAYRLPREVVAFDVEWIRSHGVEIVTGVEVGKDRTVAQLLAEGFSAVCLAVGLSRTRVLPMSGSDHPKVFPALEFLNEVGFGRHPDIGQDVLVIGGGNVAVDAARSALRLGGRRVRMMCLESAEEMPAFVWEQQEAAEEGIETIFRRGPVEVTVADGRITGVKARLVTRVFDASKRFDPQYDDSDVISIACDTVIIAIGQQAEYGFINGSGLARDELGRLTCDTATCRTSLPNVFACGEIVTPPGSVVEACASGQRAAKAIDLFLSSRPILLDDSLPPYIDKLRNPTTDKVRRVGRETVVAEEPAWRKASFAQVDRNYTRQAALRESRRCMGCGGGAEVLTDKCVACLTCLRVCPFEVPKMSEVARIDSALCQACGICIAECPANAIVHRGHEPDWIARQSREALSAMNGSPRKILAFVCGHRGSADEWAGREKLPDGVLAIYLPSLAPLRALDFLRAFEEGADAVLVVACQDSFERYPQATKRIRKRVTQARVMAKAAGVKGDRLQLFELTRPGKAVMIETIRDAAAKLNEPAKVKG
jgi:NADPH-dependent glutamate synthase beta subunit-like oxidoreductase/ferredoxin